MTNTLINNLYINDGVAAAKDTAIQSEVSVAVGSANVDDASVNDFNKIFIKTMEKQSSTLGDMSKTTENLDEALNQAILEVTMEKALDLTLARDITEIINQLKAAVNIEYAETDPISENTDAIEEEEPILPVFEQMLTFINNQTEVGNTLTEEQQLSEKYSSTEQKAINNLVEKQTYKEDVLTKKDSSETTLELNDDILKELNIESVSSEADMAGDNLMQNQQSPEEYSVKVMLNNHSDQFDMNLTKAVNSPNTAKVSEYSPDKIIEQITKHMDSIKSNSKVSMVLNPESLGKINLQIINSKDGLSAQLTVMTNDVRELLMKGLDGLKEALITNGVAVDNILVKVSEPEEAYNSDWTEQENSEGGQRGQEKQKQEEKEKGLFAKKMAESLEQKNGNV